MPLKNSFKKNILLITGALVLWCTLSGCGTSFHFSRAGGLSGKTNVLTGTLTGKHEFRVGEKLSYEIRWMGIPVGLAYLNVKEITQVSGRDCYHIIVSVKSNAFLSKIYKVDDEFHTYIDREKLYSLRFMKKQSEGNYRSHEMITYDHMWNKAVYKSLRNGTTKEFKTHENTQDDLSAIYYFRIQDIDFSKNISMSVHADEQNWKLEIRIVDRGMMNINRIGPVESLEIEPVAIREDGKKLQKGRLWIWFSADENRIPLVAKANAPIVGTVTAVLIDVQ
jgi:hypothetical protein